MAGEVDWDGPKPPPGQLFCAMHAGLAKGALAELNKDKITKLPDGQGIKLTVVGKIPLAVTQAMIMLPLPAQVPGMPPAVPCLANVCWECATGLKTLKSTLAIAGPGLIPAG